MLKQAKLAYHVGRVVMINNILLIDKPKGITSFDVIRILRKKLKIRKIGHAGTLDPLATGLLIIGIGKATKLLNQYVKLDKTYEAEILFGVKTDTGDIDGKVIEKKSIPQLSDQKINRVINSLVGEIDLPVPKYSAIKRNGKPLYKYAREGKEIIVPIKKMRINWIKGSSLHYNSQSSSVPQTNISTIHIALNVSSGTYVRSIAEEIGDRLGTVATIMNLRRIQIGQFSIDQAVTPDNVK